MKKIVILWIGLLCICLNGYALTNVKGHNGKLFEMSFIDALSGESINTVEMRDKIIIIHFWYSECSPCRKVTGIIRNLFLKYSSSRQ